MPRRFLPIQAVPIVFFTLLALAVTVLSGCSSGGGDGGAPGKPRPLTERFAIDGQVDLSVMDNVQSMAVPLYDFNASPSDPAVKTTQLQWAMTNDDRYLYVALTWTDDTYNHDFDMAAGPIDFDGVVVLFDNNGDSLHGTDEDQRTVIAASVGSQFIDQHKVAAGDATDRIGDGMAKLSYDASRQVYQAEFLVPLADDAAGQDRGVDAGTRYSIQIYDHVRLSGPSGNLGSTWGGGPDAAAWHAVDYRDAEPHAYPELPADLTGLIVFTSKHESAVNELYSFDPATGVVTRITNDPTLYKDNPSLSHDRSKVAFHGAPDDTDYNNYEIYTVDIDGGNLTRLTNNGVLDGHPAWSPDDSRIAYASFRDGGRAHIVTMTAGGVEIADLTPAGSDDNDPEYLPDGRIVFKTDRFSTFPQVRIAVMDADGANVHQVTATGGVSDHDPVGDGTWTIFERFNKGTNYATDPETGFTPWDIVEAGLDGSSETLLMDDGWVNWLPVYSPDGRYIVYLKSVPYTSAHLMTRAGRDLGRLIPGITSIRYIDWK